MASKKEQYQRWVPQAPVSNLYPYAYNFILVKSIEDLRKILDRDINAIAVDTETTGLNLDEAMMVGYSFCFDGKNAFYVPVNHAPYQEIELGTEVLDLTQIDIEDLKTGEQVVVNGKSYLKKFNFLLDIDTSQIYKFNYTEKNDNLGDEAVNLIYQAMVKSNFVFMFNQRFDVRVFEKYGFIENNISMQERYERAFYKYDMSRCNLIDVQAIIFDADTNVPYPNLKGSEEYYLGWRGASFKDTLGDAENFYHLKPSECYTYAATDALGTYLLAQKMWAYYLEPSQRTRYPKDRYPNLKNSAELDTQFLYPLMMMEDELVNVDVDMMRSYSEFYAKEIAKTEEELYRINGGSFNYASPKQKSEAFKRLNIVTYEHDGSLALNKRGEAKADKEHLQMAMEKLDKNDSRYIFMNDLIYMATLLKQKGTYADNFIEFCKGNPNGNRLRFGYKTMVVPSGRLAAGGDKKNKYFADSNIQNIPKPKMTMIYYVRYDELIKFVPELEGQYDNPREECMYKGEKTYRILDWCFKESVWHIDGLKEMKIEGFKQHLNIRSGFTPDDDKYWVSCDFSAQELRVPALLTREPLWCEVFENNGDLHEKMARVIWGDANYDKQKRKRAKRCNFGILYGMTAKNFSIDFDINMEEAQKIVDDYKAGAPVLFRWVRENEEMTKRTGITQTMFGRPRRLGWYLSRDRDRGMQNFGLRSCTNTVIQGTGADILKMSFLNIYDMFYKNPETRNINRKYIKFLNTVHDEINYNISKKNVRYIVPKVLSCMRLWLDDWDFAMQVGLEIGTRWGQTIAFDYDIEPFVKVTQENYRGQQRYRKMSDSEAKMKDIHGLKKYVEDVNGEYIKNENYLSILEPAGSPVDESDYVVKEDKNKEVEEKIEIDEDKPKIFDNLFGPVGFNSKYSRDHFMSNI